MSLPKLRRWFKDSDAGVVEDAPARYGMTAFGIEGEGREKHMNFLSLIELYTVMRLRELKVSFSTIRKAREDLAARLGVEHPFAAQSLFVDGAKLLTENDNLQYELGTNGQIAIRKVLEPFLKRVDFEETSRNLAERFTPKVASTTSLSIPVDLLGARYFPAPLLPRKHWHHCIGAARVWKRSSSNLI